MVPERTIKPAITIGEYPRVAMIVIEFVTMNCLSTFNGVLGRPLLQVAKAVTSIPCLTMKFPTIVGTNQVRERQWDSRECYN